METAESGTLQSKNLQKYLTPLNVWALSFGCAVGWGAFMMPGTTFLPIAGPLGTAIGMTIGAAIILLIGYNYHFMMNRFPDAGGTYSYAKKVLGYDHGFMSAWFLILVYIAITWANATALPIIFRKFFGSAFQFGFHYNIAGYEIYFGESLLSLGVLWILGAVCIRGGKVVAYVQTISAIVLFGGVLFCFCAVLASGINVFEILPRFAQGKSEIAAILGIVVLAPWAFVGFESVSQSVEGFKFPVKKTFAILFFAVAAGALVYIFLTLIAISVIPQGYSDWAEYVKYIDTLQGYQGMPTLNAVHKLFGDFGLNILLAAILGGVFTGIIGNYIAASRLIFAMARDDLLPEWFGKLNKFGTPQNAILFIMGLSLPIPYLGRAAINWIIDVNTIGAAIEYTYTSAVTFITARRLENFTAKITGAIGCVTAVIFFLYFIVPNFWIVRAMSSESYLILIGWSILGFIFFRYVFGRDTQKRFGKSTVVWIVLLFMIFFASMMWLREATHDTTQITLNNLSNYYVEELKEHRTPLDEREKADENYYLENQMHTVTVTLTNNNLFQMALVTVSLFIMFSIYNLMLERERNSEVQKIQAQRNSKAKSIFLSNMSHDIRTPMNAIIGYTTLIKKEKNLSPLVKNYLTKIEASNKHLLALINDVLDMSRIESGKMELDINKANIVKALDEVRDLFSTQMETKKINYVVDTANVQNKMVMCDMPRLNRVLLNLISNAFKFTPEGGEIKVTLSQLGIKDEQIGLYELRVKDSGIGMSPEFAGTVFEAYARDRNVSNIQGTGLGMAITKNIVDLMGGNISVKSALGKGTEFIVNLDLQILEDEPEEEKNPFDENFVSDIDFTKIKLLLVEDNEINREIATLILTEFGFKLETAVNGKEAVEKISAAEVGEFDAILMDIQMPVMNGYDAAAAIRNLENPALANIPIIAMTANAFSEDIQRAKAAGMNSHISKPLDIPQMIKTLTEVLK